MKDLLVEIVRWRAVILDARSAIVTGDKSVFTAAAG
jgi:hypothetical protein